MKESLIFVFFIFRDKDAGEHERPNQYRPWFDVTLWGYPLLVPWALVRLGPSEFVNYELGG